jgi:cell division GTPase FtsZ
MELIRTADLVTVIPNDVLMRVNTELTLDMAFKTVDEVIVRTIKGIIESIR